MKFGSGYKWYGYSALQKYVDRPCLGQRCLYAKIVAYPALIDGR